MLLLIHTISWFLLAPNSVAFPVPMNNSDSIRRSTRLAEKNGSKPVHGSNSFHPIENHTHARRWKRKGGERYTHRTEDLGDTLSTPLITIGAIADIQWAPVENGHSYSGVPRFYKHALEAAKIASQHFEQEQVDIVLNLGDIIDGKCQDLSMDQWISEYNQYTEDDDILAKNPGYHALLAAIDALQGYKGRILHTYGNHELYNVHREILGQKLNIPFVREPCGDLVGYYSYQLTKTGSTFRFVVIDSYDISIMKRCTESSLKRKKAEKILTEKNPNFPHRENSPDGLVGVNRRFVAFNGAVDTPQLSWLRQTLQEAKDKNERVVILSHQPILPGSSSPMCLIWNYQEVLGILREYAGVVAAAFAGHAHKGGYKRDDVSGIHFHVFEAVLESAEPIKTYAFVDVYEQHLVIRGMGNCRSAIYDLDHLT